MPYNQHYILILESSFTWALLKTPKGKDCQLSQHLTFPLCLSEKVFISPFFLHFYCCTVDLSPPLFKGNFTKHGILCWCHFYPQYFKYFTPFSCMHDF